MRLHRHSVADLYYPAALQTHSRSGHETVPAWPEKPDLTFLYPLAATTT